MPDLARFPPNRAFVSDTWAASPPTGGPSFWRDPALSAAAMLYLLIKAAVSGLLVAAISEIARRSPGWGGLLASLPLTTILACTWLYRDTRSNDQVAALAGSTFWFVLPSLPLFLVLPRLLRSGMSFWLALAIGIAGTLALYALFFWSAPKLGIKL